MTLSIFMFALLLGLLVVMLISVVLQDVAAERAVLSDVRPPPRPRPPAPVAEDASVEERARYCDAHAAFCDQMAAWPQTRRVEVWLLQAERWRDLARDWRATASSDRAARKPVRIPPFGGDA